jgi:HAD superfamily hydrolase (TIGR01549 family)
MIKAVFFDAIDTLFSAYPDKVGMYQRVLKNKAGITVTRQKMTEVWNQIVLDTEEQAAREMGSGKLAWDGFNVRLLQLLDYKGKDVEDAGKKVLFEVWSNPENFVLYNDVKPTLDILNLRKIDCICVSNETDNLIKFFDHFSIKEYFKDIVTSEEAGVEKPNPRIFEYALVNNNLEKEEVIHVGDSVISDYYGAELAGIMPVLIDRNRKIRKNIRTIENLKEITKYLESK